MAGICVDMHGHDVVTVVHDHCQGLYRCEELLLGLSLQRSILSCMMCMVDVSNKGNKLLTVSRVAVDAGQEEVFDGLQFMVLTYTA